MTVGEYRRNDSERTSCLLFRAAFLTYCHQIRGCWLWWLCRSTVTIWLFYTAIEIPSIWQHGRVALWKARGESGRLRENILSGCHSWSLPSLLASLLEGGECGRNWFANQFSHSSQAFSQNSHLNCWASLSAWVLTARVAHLILKAPTFW